MLMAHLFQMNDHDTANDWESPYFLRDMLPKLRFKILSPLFLNNDANSWQNLTNSIRIMSNAE